MCFDRNINVNRNVKFLGCNYFLLQWCVKLTLESVVFFYMQTQTAVSGVIETVIVGVNLNCDLTPKNDAKVQIFFSLSVRRSKKGFRSTYIFIQKHNGIK